MIHKFKFLMLLLVASIGSLIILSAPSAHAQGETWQLTSKTTIVVKGGLFNGNNGNPSSLTLTVVNPNVDPVIWVNSQAFDLKDSKGLSLEGRPRQAGDFCITTLNTPSLINTRTTVDFNPIARGDCAKGAQAQTVNTGGNGSGTYCSSGATTTWGCNAIWNTSAASFVTPTSKVTYAVPGAALKCGDPGFVGPCQQPIDYAKADCTKTDGTAGQAEKCQAIKACILDAQKPQADCSKAWDECIATWPDQGAGYNSCKTAIATGDFSGGKHITDAAADTTSSCKVDGIGWMICPIMTSIAGGVSGIFDIVKSFLVFQSYTTDKTYGLYPAWSIMRNFANVAFVIAFMFIIYSQLTSAGINNYGVKKMLPRLIVGAILVNVSYWLCGIAVDLSNILGSSLSDLMITLSKSVVSKGVGVSWEDATATILTGTAIGGLAGVVALGTAGSFGALLWMLVPIVLSALFAVLVAVLILAARQVLIIILIVISPLAFVAYLLPNTNKWYKKWQDTLVMLLLMFPIIALVFGGAQFASALILSVKPLTMPMVLLALATQVIPLAITPLIIKFSGGLLGKFAGVVNNPKRGPLDATKNWAKNKQELSTKRGLANANPRYNIANRLGQWRNRRSQTDKANASTYDNQAQSLWMKSQSGMASGDALAKSEMQSQIDKAGATSRVQNSLDGRALTQQLKSTETQATIDKAAADAEFTATGNIDLQLTAKAARINADAAQTAQDAVFTAISSQAGAAQINNVDDATKLAAQSAARRKLLTDLESGSATRVLQKEQTANLKDINTGYADMAAGIDPQGSNRVRATAIATEQSANADAIKHRIALLQDDSTADSLIDNAAKALQDANTNGDAVAARAATQILATQTGSAGITRLDKTIQSFEASPGGMNSAIVEGVKFDVSSSGMKSKNSALDNWAVDSSHTKLADVTLNPQTVARLNQRELSTQDTNKLDVWRQNGIMTKDHASRVIQSFETGAIDLDPKKERIFRDVIADNRAPY